MRTAPLVLLALAGCTTTASDLRNREPIATFTTTKPAALVAQCLGESVSSIGAPSIFQGPTETTITFVQRNATTLFVTIAPNGQGRVWRVNATVRYKDAIARCT